MAGKLKQPATQDRQLAKAVRESKAPAISRAAAVLRLLGKSETPLGLQAIARTLGLVPSTCLYVLRALVAEEFVAFDPDTKRYSLEAGVLTLARGWLRRNEFTDLAQPVLDRISQAFDVTMLGDTYRRPRSYYRRCGLPVGQQLPAQRANRQSLSGADQRDGPLHRRIRGSLRR